MTWGNMNCRVVSDDYKDTLVEQFPDEFTQSVQCISNCIKDYNEKSIFKDLIIRSDIYYLEVIASNGQIVKRYQILPYNLANYIKEREHDDSIEYLQKMEEKVSPKYMINGQSKIITYKGTKEVHSVTMAGARDPKLVRQGIIDMVVNIAALYVSPNDDYEKIRSIIDAFVAHFNSTFKLLFTEPELDSMVSKIKDKLKPTIRPKEVPQEEKNTMTINECTKLVGKMKKALSPCTNFGKGGYYDREFAKQAKQDRNNFLTLAERAKDPRSLKVDMIDMIVSMVPIYLPSDADDDKIRAFVDAFIKSKYLGPTDDILSLFTEADIDSIVSKIKDGLKPVLRHKEKYFAPEVISVDKAVDNYEKPSDKLLEDVKEDKDCICQLLKTDIHTLQPSDICKLKELIKVTTIIPDDKLPDTLEELETIRQTYTCRHCGKVYTKEEVSKLLYEEEKEEISEVMIKELVTTKCCSCKSILKKKDAFMKKIEGQPITNVTKNLIESLKYNYIIGCNNFKEPVYICRSCKEIYTKDEIGWLFDI